MVEHNQEMHPLNKLKFSMKPPEFKSSPLWHQAGEARWMERHRDHNLLNMIDEWGQNLPPRLTLEDNDKTRAQKKEESLFLISNIPQLDLHSTQYSYTY